MTDEVKKEKAKEGKGEAEKPIENMTVKELREIAKEIPDLTGVHAMKKEELLVLLKEGKGEKEEAPKKEKGQGKTGISHRQGDQTEDCSTQGREEKGPGGEGKGQRRGPSQAHQPIEETIQESCPGLTGLVCQNRSWGHNAPKTCFCFVCRRSVSYLLD